MDAVILNDIPFHADVPQILRSLRMREESGDADAVRTLIAEAGEVARPKALYKIAFIEVKGDDFVIVDGVRLTSRVLRVNLDKAHRVFAFVATAGAELETWAEARTDVMERYWADAIMLAALRSAREHLSKHLEQTYRPGQTARMSPGSLEDWPLPEQRALFTLLGDVQAAIGVRLTDSFLMIPRKSVSGVQFPTEESFESCMLCGRAVCPGRRAPYDPELYERKYRHRPVDQA